MAKRKMWELQQKQSLPLNLKISLTKARIRQWINEYGEDGVYVSFSGGKDSTVLLDLVRQDYNVKAVFFDTGLEYPEIREFVKGYENVDWIKPKMNFREVITKYGYPMISKEVSECVQGARKYLTSILQNETVLTDRQTDSIVIPIFTTNSQDKGNIQKKTIPSVDEESLKKLSRGGTTTSIENSEELASILNERMKQRQGGNNQRLAIMLGWLTKDKDEPIKANIPSKDRSMFSQEKYKFFLNAPFEISNKCCNVMKKQPSHNYMHETGRKPITAQMASESRLRTQKWLQHGCNAFDAKNPISNPMSFWTEQGVLKYIKDNNLPIASVYGDIVVKNNGLQGQVNIHDYLNDYRECEYCTTGCDRTGCMFCGYGLHLDKSPNRFERMAITHPNSYDYLMRGGAFDTDGLWKPTNNGLGYWFVLKWIALAFNFNIQIPNYIEYELKYGNELTAKFLLEASDYGNEQRKTKKRS